MPGETKGFTAGRVEKGGSEGVGKTTQWGEIEKFIFKRGNIYPLTPFHSSDFISNIPWD